LKIDIFGAAPASAAKLLSCRFFLVLNPLSLNLLLLNLLL
jgi:hypothetical protein